MKRRIARYLKTVILLLAVVVLPFATAPIEAGQPARTASGDGPSGTSTERATPWIIMVVNYYDSEGHYGLMRNLQLPLTSLYLEYQFAGGQTTRLDGYTSLNMGTSRAGGTPYAFRIHAEETGSILGFSRVIMSNSPYAEFTVPVPASSLGLTNGPSKQPFNGTPPGGHGTAVASPSDTFLADTRSLASVAIPVYLIPNISNRTPMFTAEYLLGNPSHETVGQETVYFPTGLFGLEGVWVMIWGYQGNPSPIAVYRPSHLPLGPIRGTLGLTGYESDSVEWQAVDLYESDWTPLLSAIPGSVDSPSPSEVLELNTLGVLEGAFILEPAIREKLLGQSELFTNLKTASDLNQDGVMDAADFIPLQAAE